MAVMWPLSLPQSPLKTGYKRVGPNMTVRSEMDTGPDKVRYRGGHKPQVIDLAYVLSAEQRDWFEEFCNGTLAGGVICFDWPSQEHGGRYVRARLVPTADGLYTLQPYQDSLYWQATFKLEIWPDAPLT